MAVELCTACREQSRFDKFYIRKYGIQHKKICHRLYPALASANKAITTAKGAAFTSDSPQKRSPSAHQSDFSSSPSTRHGMTKRQICRLATARHLK
jgi:hypothetical protein